MRLGYTLIELMIVVVVISIVILVGVNSYNTANERIAFYTELSKIQALINNARSDALSESSESIDEIYKIEFDITDNETQEIRSFVEGKDEAPTVVDVSLENDRDIVDIQDFSYLINGEWSEPDASRQTLVFEFYSPYAECNFSINGSYAPEVSMVQIPFSRSGSLDPVRYLYFHKKACLSEILTDDLTLIE